MIFSGPSGVGKDTVLDAWKACDPAVTRVIACTTRPPRAGEQDGVDYHFLSHEDFHIRAKNNAFLEFKEVHGFWYATPLDMMNQLLNDGKIAVLKIDVQGAMEAMTLRPDAISIFLAPPSMEVLESRIRSRDKDSEEVIIKRLRNAKFEMDHRNKYQHVVINNSVDAAVQKLRKITE